MEDLFAATPPLEAKKFLFSLWASMPGMCLDFIDVVRAYFHAKARRRYTWITDGGSQGDVRETQKASYGSGDAAQNWEF